LHQPIDVRRFRPRSRPSTVARRLLLLGNNAEHARLDLVADAASEAGLDLVRVGAKGTPTERPECAIDDADIVVGYGRCVLEGMACGRPTYVYDHLGGDGWVTPDTYPALEADGFGGRALAGAIDRDRMLEDLRAYEPRMGLANRDLVVAGHRAEHHAQEVVTLLERISPTARRPIDGYDELARLVTAQWHLDARVGELDATVARLREQIGVERAATAAIQALHDRAAAERDAAAARHDVVVNSLRFRIGSALARPLELARSLRRRSS